MSEFHLILAWTFLLATTLLEQKTQARKLEDSLGWMCEARGAEEASWMCKEKILAGPLRFST